MLAIPKRPANNIRVFVKTQNGIVQKGAEPLPPIKAKKARKTKGKAVVTPSVNWDGLSVEDKRQLKKLYDEGNMSAALPIVHKVTDSQFCVGCGGLVMLKMYLQQMIPTWKNI